MPLVPVTFYYRTSIPGPVFADAQQVNLEGSWDGAGRSSATWRSVPMARSLDDNGCVQFSATVSLDTHERGKTFGWGVSLVWSDQSRQWIIPTELNDATKSAHRQFRFSGEAGEQIYYLTHCRRLGANRCTNSLGNPSVRFAVWAPHARDVEVVFGKIWDNTDPAKQPLNPGDRRPPGSIAGGYVADNGTGINEDRAPLRMTRQLDGVWVSNPDDPNLPPGGGALAHVPYMYRVRMDDGVVAYRTDLYSRCQIGSGSTKPAGAAFTDLITTLDGVSSCSVTVDPEEVTQYFREEPPYLITQPPSVRVWPERHFIQAQDFWADEFTDKPIPGRIEDLIIYELHLGALGFGRVDAAGKPVAGNIEDAIALLDHIAELGFNTVELLPLSEFGGSGEGWGYGSSHYFAIEYSGGGRDQYKFLVKECHRRGLAVIMDVVYNHFAHDSSRAEWAYDSVSDRDNSYFWYEGHPENYPAYQAAFRSKADQIGLNQGGYVDNMSTAFAPRYHEEMVRKMFISSAVSLMREFHVDGFRVDQTTSIHGYNALHADGRSVPAANIFGAMLLREFGRTLRLLKPGIMLMAEDHSDWNQVTLPVEQGGMGFDARWYSEFYHHLAGDTDRGDDAAKLIYTAAEYGYAGPLKMSYFAGALAASANQKVVYNESHDEAGNSKGPFLDPLWNPIDSDKQRTSHRGLVVASRAAPLVDDTRRYAEARCRFAWGVTVLSAGTPMTLFGEEVGSVRRFKYNAVLEEREDLMALRNGTGASLAGFYRDINRLRLAQPALRTRNIRILHCNDAGRVLVFRRWGDRDCFLIFANLCDQPYASGYNVSHPDIGCGLWREVLNSDSAAYGGNNVGNHGAAVPSHNGFISVIIPYAGLVVFKREA